MRILVHKWAALGVDECIHALEGLGHTVDTLEYPLMPPEHKADDPAFEKALREKLRTHSYDALFGLNFLPLMAMVAEDLDLPYISWTYDSPLNVFHPEKYLTCKTSYAFFFDAMQAETLAKTAPGHVFHMPLAVPRNRMKNLVITPEERRRYASDISFVGQLYPSFALFIKSALDPSDRGYLEGLTAAQENVEGCYFLPRLLTDELTDRIVKQLEAAGKPAVLSPEALSFTLAQDITSRRRLVMLAFLSKHHQVTLCSNQKHASLENVRQVGTVSYSTQMPKVFALSKINLNMTLKTIETGIPLRALDIMSCGGLLMTNPQAELFDYFVPEKDFFYYTSVADAHEKCTYLLAHDDVRKKVARSGQKKTEELFTYDKQLSKMFQILPS